MYEVLSVPPLCKKGVDYALTNFCLLNFRWGQRYPRVLHVYAYGMVCPTHREKWWCFSLSGEPFLWPPGCPWVPCTADVPFLVSLGHSHITLNQWTWPALKVKAILLVSFSGNSTLINIFLTKLLSFFIFNYFLPPEKGKSVSELLCSVAKSFPQQVHRANFRAVCAFNIPSKSIRINLPPRSSIPDCSQKKVTGFQAPGAAFPQEQSFSNGSYLQSQRQGQCRSFNCFRHSQ